MADTQIRAALVYRLVVGTSTPSFGGDSPTASGGVTATLLAKYDHASQYETHGGANSGSLYGGRDKNYAEAVSMVLANDPPEKTTEPNVLGGFKVVQSDVHQIIYGADSEGICCCVITGLDYPSRVAIQMLMDMYKEFNDKFGDQAKTAEVNSLSKKSKSILSAACTKYDDLEKVDKATALLGKVDAVKVTMSENISQILKNTESADSIAQRSDQLQEQASVFKKRSTDLKKQMKCKNLKMTLILTGLVVGILCVILIPLIIKAKNASKN